MQIGTVKRFNAQTGFGVIQPDGGGGDVLMHIFAVARAGLGSLYEGRSWKYTDVVLVTYSYPERARKIFYPDIVCGRGQPIYSSFDMIIYRPGASSALPDRLETPMPSRTARNLEIIRLGAPLRRFASRLQPDPNASSFLVHQALSSAFDEPPELRRSDDLEASLRGDISRLFAEQASSRYDLTGTARGTACGTA